MNIRKQLFKIERNIHNIRNAELLRAVNKRYRELQEELKQQQS